MQLVLLSLRHRFAFVEINLRLSDYYLACDASKKIPRCNWSEYMCAIFYSMCVAG